MDSGTPIYRIRGGRPLQGEVEVSGAKNAALPIMASTILARLPVALNRVPEVRDVQTLSTVLEEVGMRVERAGCDLRIETVDPDRCRADRTWVRHMRASFCVLGPLLARRGQAVVALPGGCKIGDRPVDIHLRGFEAMGARLALEDGYVSARAERLHGATIDLAGPHGTTVTGTANLMAAATLAEGRTTLVNAACEPEIIDLARFLISLGAKIDGAGRSVITIDGVEQLDGKVTHRVVPDRIEAATFLIAATATRGAICVRGAAPSHLSAVIDLLQKVGAEIEVDQQSIRIDATGPIRAVDVVARPYPCIPTDLQAPIMAMLATAEGESIVRDEVFPDRFAHIPELVKMGADIEDLGGRVRVRGVQSLIGSQVIAPDLRAGAALVIAALAAQGDTVVRKVDRIDRGYRQFAKRLRQLGVQIDREVRKSR